MKPRDPQEMEALGPDEPWSALTQQEIEEWEQWLERMEDEEHD